MDNSIQRMSLCTNPILDDIYDNGRKTSLVYTEFSLVLLSTTAIFKACYKVYSWQEVIGSFKERAIHLRQTKATEVKECLLTQMGILSKTAIAKDLSCAKAETGWQQSASNLPPTTKVQNREVKSPVSFPYMLHGRRGEILYFTSSLMKPTRSRNSREGE